MTYGQILMIGGITLVVIGVLTLVIGTIVMNSRIKDAKNRKADRIGL